jgi:hypothetical protein
MQQHRARRATYGGPEPVGTALTPGGCPIGYLDRTSCLHSVFFTIRPARVAATFRVCRSSGYVDLPFNHPGRHQLNVNVF